MVPGCATIMAMKPPCGLLVLAALIAVAGCVDRAPVAIVSDDSPETRVHELALAGDAEAQVTLGWMLETGSGFEADPAQAVLWYRKAVAQNNALAQYALGEAYARGVGVPRNYAMAAAWFRRAAEQGNASAQFRLGYLYEHGLGVPRDARAANAWYVYAGFEWRDQVSQPPSTERAVAYLPAPLRLTPPRTWPDQGAPSARLTETETAPVARKLDTASGGKRAGDEGLWVHVASFRTPRSALKGWDELKRLHPGLLGPLALKLSRVDLGGTLGEWIRVRVGPLPDIDAAKTLCRSLRARDTYCVARGN